MRAGLVVAVVVGLLYALRQLDLEAVAAALRSAHPGWLALAAVANLASQVTRAVGWNALLPLAVPFRRLVRFEYAVQATSAVSPEGAGELIRVGYLRGEGVPATATVSLMAARKLLSSVGLVPLIVLAWWPRGQLPGWASGVLTGYAVAMTVLLVLLLRVAPAAEPGTPPAPGEGWKARLRQTLRAARASLVPLRRGRTLGVCLAGAVSTRLLDLLGAAAVLAGLGLNLTWAQIVLVLTLIELSNVLPTAPAQLGTFEAAVLVGVAGALAQPQAVAFAVVLHLQQLLPQTLAGLAVMPATAAPRTDTPT